MERLIALSPLLTPLVMLVSLAVSAYIGLMVYQFTRRQAQMAALQLVHLRWAEINKTIIAPPMLQRLLNDERFAGKTDEKIIAYNFLFQILNVVHEVHFAAGTGWIDRTFAARALAGTADVLRHRRAEVLEMLAGNRGYEHAFSEAMARLMAS